ncbi:hypothetical protein [Paracoccus ravus]|uniref:hypothetical protein n=1 Tax=Paracoccus ravus TaxID=2447760 RepID=UPI001ADCC617|nr:hypothetical protein [Paracoccus ravus]
MAPIAVALKKLLVHYFAPSGSDLHVGVGAGPESTTRNRPPWRAILKWQTARHSYLVTFANMSNTLGKTVPSPFAVLARRENGKLSDGRHFCHRAQLL